MIGGGPYTCGVYPSFGENDFWNESRCMSCGYEEQEEDEEE